MTNEINKLPKGWQRVTLGEITSLVQNGVYKSADKYGYGYPLLRMYNIQNTSYNLNCNHLARVMLDKSEFDAYKVKAGDILVSRVNSFELVGKSAWVSSIAEGYVFENMLIRIRLKDSVNSLFIALQMGTHAVRRQIEGFAKRASGQSSINSSDIRNIQIVLPPLSYQNRVAAILEKCDRLRRTRRYSLQMGETFLQSVFLEMFGDPVTNPMGWECVTISDIVTLTQYGTSEKSNSEKRGYPVLGMSNISYKGYIDLTSISYVELTEKEFLELKLIPGDIVFNRTNSTELVGKTAHWKYNHIDAVLASYLVKIKLKNQVLPDYFVHLLNSKYFKQLFQERCKKAIGQSNISPTLLKEFPALVPPLPLQEKFAQIVQKHDRIRTQQREAERQAEHLFQTLLHRAFRGELQN